MTNTECFTTCRLHLAVFLHATQLLTFIRCERCPDSSNIQFIFFDPEQRAADIELGFEQGSTASARDLFGSLRFLRKQMNDVLKGAK